MPTVPMAPASESDYTIPFSAHKSKLRDERLPDTDSNGNGADELLSSSFAACSLESTTGSLGMFAMDGLRSRGNSKDHKDPRIDVLRHTNSHTQDQSRNYSIHDISYKTRSSNDLGGAPLWGQPAMHQSHMRTQSEPPPEYSDFSVQDPYPEFNRNSFTRDADGFPCPIPRRRSDTANSEQMFSFSPFDSTFASLMEKRDSGIGGDILEDHQHQTQDIVVGDGCPSLELAAVPGSSVGGGRPSLELAVVPGSNVGGGRPSLELAVVPGSNVGGGRPTLELAAVPDTRSSSNLQEASGRPCLNFGVSASMQATVW